MKKVICIFSLLLGSCFLYSACGGSDTPAEKWCKNAIETACEKGSECDSLQGMTVAQCIDQMMALTNNCDNATWDCPAAASGADACLAAIKAQSCTDFNAQVKPEACNLCPED
ncbi:MAG: hypothetical protein GYA21_03270 [Myxococcales bacterium]|nr:hypothetical protein [Myxococcales bacterium]